MWPSLTQGKSSLHVAYGLWDRVKHITMFTCHIQVVQPVSGRFSFPNLTKNQRQMAKAAKLSKIHRSANCTNSINFIWWKIVGVCIVTSILTNIWINPNDCANSVLGFCCYIRILQHMLNSTVMDSFYYRDSNNVLLQREISYRSLIPSYCCCCCCCCSCCCCWLLSF